MEKFSLNEGKGKYRFEVSIKFATLKDFEAEVDINSTWETNREYQNFSQREFRLL
jgi:hypothetical protein